jgi:hypothetical protein
MFDGTHADHQKFQLVFDLKLRKEKNRNQKKKIKRKDK